MKRFFVAVVLFGVVWGAQAQAQTRAIQPYVGELIMDRDGRLSPPWKEVKACNGKTDTCGVAIINTKTQESAALDGKWFVTFQPTGEGKEVRRAEAPAATVKRLNLGAIDKPAKPIRAPHELPAQDPKYGPVPKLSPKN